MAFQEYSSDSQIGQEFKRIDEDLEKALNSSSKFHPPSTSLEQCGEKVSASNEESSIQELQATVAALKAENNQLRLQLQDKPIAGASEVHCLRVEFISKMSVLIVSYRDSVKTFSECLKRKLHQNILASLNEFESELKNCQTQLGFIDERLGRRWERDNLSDSEDSANEDCDNDQAQLTEVREKCANMTEELKVSFKKYDKLFASKSGELLQPFTLKTVAFGDPMTDVTRQDCKDFLTNIDRMCAELAERKEFFEKLHKAVKFTQEQRKRFQGVRKQIKIFNELGNEAKPVQASDNQVSRSLSRMMSTTHRGTEEIADDVDGLWQLASTMSEKLDNWRKEVRDTLPRPLDPSVFSTTMVTTDSHGSNTGVLSGGQPTYNPMQHSALVVGLKEAPSPKKIKAFLEFYKERLLDKFDVNGIKEQLFNKKIIPGPLRTRINEAEDLYGANTLFIEHALKSYDFPTCMTLCETMKCTDGYPRMNRLGDEMMQELKSNEVEYKANDL